MSNTSTLVLLVVAILMLLVLCAMWQHLTALRYGDMELEKGKQYKWYQLFGKLNEIGLWVKIFAVLFFGMMIFVCLHYICVTYPHQNDQDRVLDFDYFSIISSFFAVLVTLLVGWNIYNTLNAKEEIKKSIEKSEKIEKRINILANKVVNERISDYDHQVKSELNLIRGLTWAQKGTPALALKYFIEALYHQNLCKEPTHKEEIIEFIDSIITPNVKDWLTKTRLNKAIELVSKSNADGSVELLRKLAEIDIEKLQPF